MHNSIPMQRLPSNPYDNSSPHTLPYHNGNGRARPPPPQAYTSVRPPVARKGSVLRRGKTLTRPERAVAPVPLINPRLSVPGLSNNRLSTLNLSSTPNGGAYGSRGGSAGGNLGISPSLSAPDQSSLTSPSTWNWWKISSTATTFWIPDVFLSGALKLRTDATRQAWREKVTFCWIALVLGAAVGFITMGLQPVMCPPQSGMNRERMIQRLGRSDQTLGISGWQFSVNTSKPTQSVDFYTLSRSLSGQDISNYFTRSPSDFPSCNGLDYTFAKMNPCGNSTVSPGGDAVSGCPLPAPTKETFDTLSIQNTSMLVGYSWNQVNALEGYMVINGKVLNFSPYLRLNPNEIKDDPVDEIIRKVAATNSTLGKDGTRLVWNRQRTIDAVPCLMERYMAGVIDKTTPGCFFAAILLYTTLVVIMSIILIRFAMACIFAWFIAPRMADPPAKSSLPVVSPAVLPQGASLGVKDKNGMAPWAGQAEARRKATLKRAGGSAGSGMGSRKESRDEIDSLAESLPAPIMSLSQLGTELFTLCLVTCYSEGDDSIRGTLESISNTDFPDSRKLLFVVCDGMITGSGEKKSTPDICIDMMEADPRFGAPQPMGYIAVGVGVKRENAAKVYAGHYKSKMGRRTPMIIVVKTGNPGEKGERKAGNRGKRDSQMILMNFISRVNYNDPFSPLDYDMFRKTQVLCGVTPDYFELVLMVDADTRVYPSSLRIMVNCMYKDPDTMGLCGETTIANKKASWVTMIQVFEYFISHHQAKAFESTIHTVSCLPGCFSIYRLKARKPEGDDWVPILASGTVCQSYSQSDPASLHEKSLLELGEDRFLSTLMIRTFPARKMLFCPKAKCKTVVPDTFSVLLSQRRRWICSSIHNLIELLKVPNLCGIFCCSMSFIVLLELFGTIVLPVAICLTFALIVNTALQPPTNFQEAIPVILLVGVLGLPAVLVLITTRRVVYVGWMVIYLLSLPIWNFVLPAYSFIKMDDLSWGATRQVAGQPVKARTEDKTAIFDGTSIPLRKWSDWERSRLRKLRRAARKQKEAEKLEKRARQQFRGPPGSHGFLGTPVMDDRSDAHSSISDEDMWGSDIGGYDETAPSWPMPPRVFLPPDAASVKGETMGVDEMTAMLEQGFDDRRPQSRHDHNRAGPDNDNYYDRPPIPNGYPPPPLPYNGHAPDSMSTSVQPRYTQGHAKKRSAGSNPVDPGQIFRPY